MNDTQRKGLAAVLCLTLLIGVISGCQTPTPATTQAPTPTQEPGLFLTPRTFEGLFAKELFIITGPVAQVHNAVEILKQRDWSPLTTPDPSESSCLPDNLGDTSNPEVAVTELESLDLWYVLPFDEKEGWVMNLYSIGTVVSSAEDLPDVLKGRGLETLPSAAQAVVIVNAVAEACSLSVAADLVSDISDVRADPWSVQGSPWSGLWPSTTATADTFKTQWAFTQIGLNDDGGNRLNEGARGAGVRIGVFDSFPAGYETLPEQSSEVVSGPFVNHGPFVVSLIREIAPDSDICLYRVLDDKGMGDLLTLNFALHTFISRTLAVQGEGTRAVISLSLGHPEKIQAALQHEYPGASGLIEAYVPQEPSSLYALLAAARLHGIVVVAAAGNEDQEPWSILDPQCSATPSSLVFPFPTDLSSQDITCEDENASVPAVFASVLGVAASTYERNMACFSFGGDVMAPGGDGQGECIPPVVNEMAFETEGLHLVLIGQVPTSPEYPKGYAYGVGTSFAAPLVSGQAALLLGADVLPSDVPGTIMDSTDDNGGVIYLPAALPSP